MMLILIIEEYGRVWNSDHVRVKIPANVEILSANGLNSIKFIKNMSFDYNVIDITF